MQTPTRVELRSCRSRQTGACQATRLLVPAGVRRSCRMALPLHGWSFWTSVAMAYKVSSSPAALGSCTSKGSFMSRCAGAM